MKLHRRVCIVVVAAVAVFGAARAEVAPLARVGDMESSARPAGVPLDYVITPAGFFHAACVVQLEDGEQLTPEGDVSRHDQGVRKVTACQHASYDLRGQRRVVDAQGIDARPAAAFSGWIADSQSSGTPPASQMVADWIVPSSPISSAGQTLYFFPGLEATPNVVTILQPVLGWNSYGNATWTMANWNCCKSGTVYTGNPITVRPGDQIHGAMVGTGCSRNAPCGSWAITSTDVTTNQSTTLKTSSWSQLFNWYFGGVMEVYGVGACTQLPANGSITFTNVKVYDTSGAIVTPAWRSSIASGAPRCGYVVNASTNQTQLTFTP